MCKKLCVLSLVALIALGSLACPPPEDELVTVTLDNRSSHPTVEFYFFASGGAIGPNRLSSTVPAMTTRFIGSFAPGTYEAIAVVDVPNKGVAQVDWAPILMQAGEDWTLNFNNLDLPGG